MSDKVSDDDSVIAAIYGEHQPEPVQMYRDAAMRMIEDATLPGTGGDTFPTVRDNALADAFASAMQAALRAQQQAAGWRVKPLKWEHFDSHHMAYATVPSLWIAYRIALRTDGRKVVRLEMLGDKNGDLGTCRSWEEAKHTAQSDYAARINSAIEPAPVADGYVMVPVEPTEAMLTAMAESYGSSPCMDIIGPMEDAYRAILAARPISASGRDGE